MNCSDWSTGWVCRDCGSMISLGYDDLAMEKQQITGFDYGVEEDTGAGMGPKGEYCRVCKAKSTEEQAAQVAAGVPVQPLKRQGQMDLVPVPFVFKYLLAELAAMNIKLSIELK